MAPSRPRPCHCGNTCAGGSGSSVHIKGLGGGGRAGASALMGCPALGIAPFFARLRPSPSCLELGSLHVPVDYIHDDVVAG